MQKYIFLLLVLLINSVFSQDIKVETCCTDGIDNDRDGYVDNADGDCWIREGAVFVENYYMTTFSDYLEILPELTRIGIKTLEMLPVWEHCTSNNTAQRWAVRNFAQVDPMRGDENGLRAFIDTAHNYGIKVLTCMVETGLAVPPYPDCGGYYDKDGIGGALYLHQLENPDKDILLRDESGGFICGIGVQYAVNWSSPDVWEFFKNVYKQIQNHGFDGQRLDAPCELTCKEGEKIYSWMCGWGIVCSDCEGKFCPFPIDTVYSPITYYRELLKIKSPDQVFIGETPSLKAAKSNWFCFYPFYPPDVMLDEVAEASESVSFPYLMSAILNLEISSNEFIEWLNNEPVSYNRQRFRFISTWTRATKPIANFIINDLRYFPMVALVATIPGIPKVTHYELYGNRLVEEFHGIPGNSEETSEARRNYWNKILNIRNNNNALTYGSVRNLWQGGDTIFAYLRSYENESAVVVVNFLGKDAVSAINLSFIEKGASLYDELNDTTIKVDDPGNFEIKVPLYGSRIFVVEGTAPVENKPDAYIPKSCCLLQSYPNPFNPKTVISYQLSVFSNVTLKIYDMLGKEVRTLVNENKPAGEHSVVWNGKDNSGQQLSSGIYFYSLKLDNLSAYGHAQADNYSITKKLLLLK